MKLGSDVMVIEIIGKNARVSHADSISRSFFKVKYFVLPITPLIEKLCRTHMLVTPIEGQSHTGRLNV